MVTRISVCVVIATKNRQEKLKNLLESITRCSKIPDAVVIVSSGENIGEILRKFEDKIPIVHKHTAKSGQVYQRNLALEEVINKYDIYAFLDDDVTLDSNFFSEIDKAFTIFDDDLGGIGINYITSPKSGTQNIFWKKIQKTKYIKSFAGKVIKSGRNLSYLREEKTIRTDWLNGLSIWTNKVLLEFKHVEMDNYYAAAEDLIFSYQVRSRYKLFFCPEIKVYEQNNELVENERAELMQISMQHKLFFVLNNKNLKKSYYLLDLIFEIIIRMCNLVKGNIKNRIQIIYVLMRFLMIIIFNYRKISVDQNFKKKLLNEIL
jgi:glycosyltransferase involved in cell wall biosynthesis